MGHTLYQGLCGFDIEGLRVSTRSGPEPIEIVGPGIRETLQPVTNADGSGAHQCKEEAPVVTVRSAFRITRRSKLSRRVCLKRYQSPLADERQEVTLMTASLRAAQQCHRLASRLEVNPPTHSLDVVILVWRVL